MNNIATGPLFHLSDVCILRGTKAASLLLRCRDTNVDGFAVAATNNHARVVTICGRITCVHRLAFRNWRRIRGRRALITRSDERDAREREADQSQRRLWQLNHFEFLLSCLETV